MLRRKKHCYLSQKTSNKCGSTPYFGTPSVELVPVVKHLVFFWWNYALEWSFLYCADKAVDFGQFWIRGEEVEESIATYYGLSRLVWPSRPPLTLHSATRKNGFGDSYKQNIYLTELSFTVFTPPYSPLPTAPHAARKAPVQHHMWACADDPLPPITTPEQWETALSCSHLTTQQALKDRAAKVAEKLRLLAASLAQQGPIWINCSLSLTPSYPYLSQMYKMHDLNLTWLSPTWNL